MITSQFFSRACAASGLGGVLVTMMLAGCGGAEAVDRAAVYGELGTNVIAPSYAELRSKTVTLDTAATSYCADAIDTTRLETLREALREAHLAYERTKAFEFAASPVTALQISAKLDSFPITLASTSTTVPYILTSTDSIDLALLPPKVQGFYTVEYVLFEPGTIGATVAAFTDPVTGTRRCEYLASLTSRIAALADQAADVWDPPSTTSFGSAIASPGDNGSPYATLGAVTTDLIVSGYNLMHELSDMRLGLPLGVLSVGATSPDPSAVPGHLGDLTTHDLRAALDGFESLYFGRFGDVDGRGIEDVVRARSAERNLEVVRAVQQARDAIEAMPASVDLAVVDPASADYASVLLAFERLKSLQTILSVSVGPILGISSSAFLTDGD